MAEPTTRRFRVWYALFVTAVLMGGLFLTMALELDNAPMAAALVFAGLVIAVAIWLIQVVRIVRRP